MISLALLVVIAIAIVASSRWMDDSGTKDRDMRELGHDLDVWSTAGLITAEQASAIAGFELQRRETSGVSKRMDRRGMAAEAIGYVGAALAVGAVMLFLSDLWDQLVVVGRLVLVGLLTVLVGAGGLALHRIDREPMQRLASVLLATTVFGVGWLAFIVGYEVLHLRDADVGLLIGVAAIASALPMFLLRRRAMSQLTLFVSAAIALAALLARPALELEPMWVGLAFWAFGVAWLLLGIGNWLPPRPVAEVLGGAAALLAAQFASFDSGRTWLLWLGVVTASALVAMAVVRDRVHHLAVGAVGLFVFVPQLAFDLFGDAIGAPATLLVVGLLLVLLAIGIGRARREVRP